MGWKHKEYWWTRNEMGMGFTDWLDTICSEGWEVFKIQGAGDGYTVRRMYVIFRKMD